MTQVPAVRFPLYPVHLQVLVAEAPLLESLSVTNWPNEMVAGGMAFEDSWVGHIMYCSYLM